MPRLSQPIALGALLLVLALATAAASRPWGQAKCTKAARRVLKRGCDQESGNALFSFAREIETNIPSSDAVCQTRIQWDNDRWSDDTVAMARAEASLEAMRDTFGSFRMVANAKGEGADGSTDTLLSVKQGPVNDRQQDLCETSAAQVPMTQTVFRHNAKEKRFYRDITTVPDYGDDGTLAINTFLSKDSPAYGVLESGNTFKGDVMLFGIGYRSIYEPIVCATSGDIIGALYVGVPLVLYTSAPIPSNNTVCYVDIKYKLHSNTEHAEALALASLDSLDAAMGAMRLLINSNGANADGSLDTIVSKNQGAVNDYQHHLCLSSFVERGITQTVFRLHAEDENFVRDITTVPIGPGGALAINTVLSKASPAYKVLVAGGTYTGQAVLFGVTYQSIYRPIPDASNGVVIGALYVGVAMKR